MPLKFNFKSGITNCTGAEVKITSEGIVDVRFVKLSSDQKSVHIEAKNSFSSDLKKIPEKALENLAITITGKGVLIKKTSKLDELTEHNLQHLFPNFKFQEFYVQNFISEHHSFISIIRKETANHIIQSFERQGFKILAFSIGPFISEQVLPQLNVYGTSIGFDGHQVVLNEDKSWKDYHYKIQDPLSFALKVDNEVIPPQYILAYATAFQLILHEKLDLIEVDEPSIKENLLELSSKLKFEKRGTFALLCFFLLLLINFLIFNIYNDKNSELLGRAGQQSNLYANRDKLEKEVKEKELLVKKLGWNKGLSYAYICDQIGQILPNSILLTVLTINEPSQNLSTAIKPIVRETGKVRLKGEAANVYAINDFIYALKHLPWIKDVQLEKYVTDDQKQVQVFTLILIY